MERVPTKCEWSAPAWERRRLDGEFQGDRGNAGETPALPVVHEISATAPWSAAVPAAATWNRWEGWEMERAFRQATALRPGTGRTPRARFPLAETIQKGAGGYKGNGVWPKPRRGWDKP